MKINIIDKYLTETITNNGFWGINKKVCIGILTILLVILLFNTTGCTQKEAPQEAPQPVEELPKDNVKVGNDGVNAAIAPDDTANIKKEVPETPNTVSMVAMSVEDMGRADPFLPDSEIIVVKPRPKFNYDLLPPPEAITADASATEVIGTKVSGIMYDTYNPSAILNIKGSDYLVRSGDIINGYKILAIGKELVTVQKGANVYKAGVGELFNESGINYNTVSNLESKFGGRKNIVNK